MSILANSKVPKGFGQYNLPALGAGQRDIYGLLQGKFMQGGGDAFQNLLGMSQGNEDVFSKLEAPMMQKFQREILPSIANRYGGAGISNSSGMQNAMTSAATDLGTQLQAQRAGLMQQSMRDVLGIGEHLLGTPTQQFGLYQKENWLRNIMQMIGNAGAQMGGMYGGAKLATML